MTGCAAFLARLQSYGDQEALCTPPPQGRCSYGELLRRKERWLEVLKDRGVEPGAVVSVEGYWSAATTSLALALMSLPATTLPIGRASPRERERFKEIACVGAEFRFSSSDDWELQQPGREMDNEILSRFRRENKAGLVLFSSGSTGDSKGMLHNLDRMLEKYEKKRKALRTIIFLAFDHIGGVNTFYHVLANGGTLIVPAGRDPAGVCETIENFRAELLPTSPSFLNLLLLSREYENHDLSSLKLITYGTEMISDYTLSRIAELFPDVKIQQTYGLSELGILRSKSRSSDSKFVKIGGEGYQLKVVDGVLWIRADAAMVGYLNAPDPFDEDRWFCTDDLVEQDGEYIKFLGRATELINVGGEKVFPAEVEGVLLEMPEIRDLTVFGRAHSMMGSMVVARITPTSPEETASSMKKKVRKFCKGRLAPFKVPSKVELTSEEQFNYRYKKLRRDLPKGEG